MIQSLNQEQYRRQYAQWKESKPVAPDGLWISRYDDPDPVDGGV